MSDSVLVAADGVDPAGVNVLLNVLAQVKGGDFSARMPFEWTGVPRKPPTGTD